MELTKTHFVAYGRTKAECGMPTGHMNLKPNHALTNSIDFVTCPDCLDKIEARVKEAKRENTVLRIVDIINEDIPDIVPGTLNIDLCDEDVETLNEFDEFSKSGSDACRNLFKPELCLYSSNLNDIKGMIETALGMTDELRTLNGIGDVERKATVSILDEISQRLSGSIGGIEQYQKTAESTPSADNKDSDYIEETFKNGLSSLVNLDEKTGISSSGVNPLYKSSVPGRESIFDMTMSELHREKLISEVTMARLKVQEKEGLTVNVVRSYGMSYDGAKYCAEKTGQYLESESMAKGAAWTIKHDRWVDRYGIDVDDVWTPMQFKEFTKEMWRVVT